MIKNGWYYCQCGKKLFMVLPQTELKSHVCYCSKCKREDVINIKNNQVEHTGMIVSGTLHVENIEVELNGKKKIVTIYKS